MICIKIKFAKDIIKEIKERGPIQVSENSVTGEEFEKWLIEKSDKNLKIKDNGGHYGKKS